MHDRMTGTGRRLARPAGGAGMALVWRGVRRLGAVLLWASLAVACVSAAEEDVPRTFLVEAGPLPLPGAVRDLPPVAQAAPETPGAHGALGNASLDTLRGGTGTPWSEMALSGTVGGNTAINVATGTNTITDGAFSNASGLPMVIQNSGANVLIQNATIVNVQIR
ncbi:hypothetical protein [Pseudoduganella lutea]|uniref:hypothetical protein n=1 Tax=Pseudoduganella lutea TaxID=321985 RepID=UPI001E4BF6AE|nr:hypothetical protein [Pseudoduganella lutea]